MRISKSSNFFPKRAFSSINRIISSPWFFACASIAARSASAFAHRPRSSFASAAATSPSR